MLQSFVYKAYFDMNLLRSKQYFLTPFLPVETQTSINN